MKNIIKNFLSLTFNTLYYVWWHSSIGLHSNIYIYIYRNEYVNNIEIERISKKNDKKKNHLNHNSTWHNIIKLYTF